MEIQQWQVKKFLGESHSQELLFKVPALRTAEVGFQEWPEATSSTPGPRFKKRQGTGSLQASAITEVSDT